MHLAPYYTSLTIRRFSDGQEIKVALPRDAKAGAPVWSPDGIPTRWSLYMRNRPDRALFQDAIYAKAAAYAKEKNLPARDPATN